MQELDPYLWPDLGDYRRIWLRDDGESFTIVDACVYDELMQWKWHLFNYGGKQYAKRTKRADDDWRLPKSIYMHRWLARRYLRKPSKMHVIVDHRFGNGLDNRLAMIRWGTLSQNRKNAFGRWWQAKQLVAQINKASRAHLTEDRPGSDPLSVIPFRTG